MLPRRSDEYAPVLSRNDSAESAAMTHRTTYQGLLGESRTRRSSVRLDSARIVVLLAALLVAGCSSTPKLHGNWLGYTSERGSDSHRISLKSDNTFAYLKNAGRNMRQSELAGTWKYDEERDLTLFRTDKSSFIGQLVTYAEDRRFMVMSIDGRYVRLFLVNK